jgi:hypothetical protein
VKPKRSKQAGHRVFSYNDEMIVILNKIAK